jgi:hypothetical protein
MWRVKLVAEMRPGVTETEVARIERDEQANLAELGLARRSQAAGRVGLIVTSVSRVPIWKIHNFNGLWDYVLGLPGNWGRQAATAACGIGSLVGWNLCPKPGPSVPFQTAQRT